jgi:hypothetical protein
MRFARTAILAGIATATLAGAAFAACDAVKQTDASQTAAQKREMLVALPDGSVRHIAYREDAAPVTLVAMPQAAIPQPGSLFAAAFGADSPFAEMERISAMMEARSQAMWQQVAAMQAQAHSATAGTPGKGIVMTNAQGEPVGVMQYSYVSSTTSADGCTQTVSYSSDGADAAGKPRLIQTSSGSCGSAAKSAPAIVPTAAPQPEAPAPASPRTAPKITPVSAPKPLPAFTPSRT